METFDKEYLRIDALDAPEGEFPEPRASETPISTSAFATGVSILYAMKIIIFYYENSRFQILSHNIYCHDRVVHTH